MLIGINPILNADILHTLVSMGHGDEVLICDANFPAASVAKETVLGTHLESGVDALSALKAVLSVLPVDTFDLDVSAAIRGMQIVGAPDDLPEIVVDANPIIEQVGSKITLVERHAFYADAKKTYAVIRTTEARFYGNFIIRKGVVEPAN